nr:hypothetical protein [uncultured Lachnoclostridium sp.]
MKKLTTKLLRNFAESSLRNEVSYCHYYCYQPKVPQMDKIVERFGKRKI